MNFSKDNFIELNRVINRKKKAEKIDFLLSYFNETVKQK